MDRNVLLGSIESLKLRKADLLQELEQVELDLKTQQAQYSRQTNEDAAIYKLPTEILTSIFMTCKRTPRRPRTPLFQVMASHVSHRWREVSLSTPLLWNTIDFKIRSKNHVQRAVAQLVAHLERSGSCFLDITLEFHIAGELSAYFEPLAAHSGRWRRLSIATQHEQVDDIRLLLHYTCVPNLEHLSLIVGTPNEGSSSPRKQYNSMFTTILRYDKISTPLSFLRLAGHALGNLHPPMSSVTTLNLGAWTRHYMTHDQVRLIFEGTPSLVNLSLSQLCVHHPRDPLAVMQPANLPHLRSLRIHGPCSPLFRLLSLMNLPQLHSLNLQNVDTFDSHVLESVQTLCLDACAFDEQDIGNLIQALPSISSLSIDDSMPDIFFMLLPASLELGSEPEAPESWSWPLLQTITIRDLQFADVPHFCSMVFNRRDGPNALRKMQLDRRSRSVLQKRERLDWLHDQLVVEDANSFEPWPLGLGYEDAHDLLE